MNYDVPRTWFEMRDYRLESDEKRKKKLIAGYEYSLAKQIDSFLEDCDEVSTHKIERVSEKSCVIGCMSLGKKPFKLIVCLDPDDTDFKKVHEVKNGQGQIKVNKVAIVSTFGEAYDIIKGLKEYDLDSKQLVRAYF